MAEEGGLGARLKTTTASQPAAMASTSTSSVAGTPGTTVIVTGAADAAFAPSSFRGTESEDAEAWLLGFEKYAVYRGFPMLTNVKHAFINCSGDGSRNATCSDSCRVTIPCSCSLESDSFYLPSRIENCHSERRGRKVLHAVNLAFLQNFFEASQLADLPGTSLLENSLKIVTPKLKILEANSSHELQVDKHARLDLAKLANLTKEDEQAYPSLAHSMVHSWQEYSVALTTCLSAQSAGDHGYWLFSDY